MPIFIGWPVKIDRVSPNSQLWITKWMLREVTIPKAIDRNSKTSCLWRFIYTRAVKSHSWPPVTTWHKLKPGFWWPKSVKYHVNKIVRLNVTHSCLITPSCSQRTLQESKLNCLGSQVVESQNVPKTREWKVNFKAKLRQILRSQSSVQRIPTRG